MAGNKTENSTGEPRRQNRRVPHFIGIFLFDMSSIIRRRRTRQPNSPPNSRRKRETIPIAR
jgi:hypothetical protein